MLYREIIAVCSQIHTKHVNTLCGQNVELLNVKPGGIYSYQFSLSCTDVDADGRDGGFAERCRWHTAASAVAVLQYGQASVEQSLLLPVMQS
jgi:hypothetical protein